MIGVLEPVSAYTPHDPIYIDGNENFTYANGVVGGDGTPLDPYVIEGWEIGSYTDDGIYINNTDVHFVIRDVLVKPTTRGGHGIYVSNVANGTICKSMISNNYMGIVLSSSTNVAISDNSVSSTIYDGIAVQTSSNISVNRNTVSTEKGNGIHLKGSLNNVVIFNRVSDFVDGIYVEYSRNSNVLGNVVYGSRGEGIEVHGSVNTTIKGNIVSSNNMGIWVDTSENATIVSNIVSSTTWYGISIADVSNLTIMGNTISNNRNGIVARSPVDALIYHNNFISNVFQAYDDSISTHWWDNGYPTGGNYWSDYAGVDEKSGPDQDQPGPDGIGDSPYEISVNSRDRYPLMTPVVIIEWISTPPNPIVDNQSHNVVWFLSAINDTTHTDVHYSTDPLFTTFSTTPEQLGSPGIYADILTLSCSVLTDYYIKAHAVVDSSDYYSMTLQRICQPPIADLHLSEEDISFDPPPPIHNDTNVDIVATVGNVGTMYASNILVRFYDGPPSPFNQINDDAIISFLPKGGRESVRVSWTPTTEGNHEICVFADPDDLIEESDETNNLACRYVQVFSPIPPSPPVDLEAFLSGEGFRDVTLRWNLSLDDGGGSMSVVRYDIYRSSNYDHDRQGYPHFDFVPSGTGEFVDLGAGEGDPSNYFYYVCAVTNANLSSCTINQVGKFTRPLSQGPNLISIPLIQSNESVEHVLQTVKYDKAWYYDSSSREWKWYTTSKGYRRGLWNMNQTTGIWVNITENSNLTVAGIVPAQTTIYLYEGWNLVSFPSFNATYTVADLKVEIGVMRVEGMETMPPFPPSRLRVLTDLDALQAGYGYWVRVEADVDWMVEVS